MLEQVSQNLPEDPRFSRCLTLTQAADVALCWMDRLQMVRERKWRLESAPEYSRGVWTCQFFSANARVLVIVRGSDGQLLFAQITGN